MTKTLPLFCLSLATLTACNEHPIKDVEMNSWADDGFEVDGTGGNDDGGGDGFGDESGDAGASDAGLVDPPATCDADEYEVDELRPAVMLVLDKSGSMFSHEWEVGGDMVTRWNSLHGVVSDVTQTHDGVMSFGAVLFPAADSNGCGVSSEPDLPIADTNTAQDVLDVLPGADAHREGYTPMRAGLQTARDAIIGVDAARPRAMILVTDGLANCVDGEENGDHDDEVDDLVGEIHQQDGISTFVIGIDISDAYDPHAGVVPHDAISEVAAAGGVPRSDAQPYYAASDEDALYEALDAIAQRLECTIQLDAPVSADDTFEVTIGGDAIAEVAACDEGDGWRFSDPQMRTTIELCGGACDALQVEGRVATQTCTPGTLEPGTPVP